MKIWTTNLGKFAQYCVHFLATTARTEVGPIPAENMQILDFQSIAEEYFSFLIKKYFFLVPCGLMWVDKCGYERQKLPLYKNMQEENREIQCGESTQIRYGGGVTAVMTSVRLWKVEIATLQKPPLSPQMGIQTLLSLQNISRAHKKRFFSVYEKQSRAVELVYQL